MRDTGTLYVLIGRVVSEEIKIPDEALSLIKEFGYLSR